MGGNQVKIRQAVDSCVGMRIIIIKKQLSDELNVCVLFKRLNTGEIVRMCVSVLDTTFRGFFVDILSFTCISVPRVICLVNVPGSKDEGVWLVILT